MRQRFGLVPISRRSGSDPNRFRYRRFSVPIRLSAHDVDECIGLKALIENRSCRKPGFRALDEPVGRYQYWPA